MSVKKDPVDKLRTEGKILKKKKIIIIIIIITNA